MLKVSSVDYQAMRRHGQETYPRECCGILLGAFEGETRTVRATVRCTNIHKDSPETRYDIDPHELVRAQRQGREQGLEIVGFYHSHPDHPARWSPTDLENAHWVGCSYVIIEVDAGEAMRTDSFALVGTREEDKAFMQEEVIVED
jgi:proteasome lid subunit RPN8/RPN11